MIHTKVYCVAKSYLFPREKLSKPLFQNQGQTMAKKGKEKMEEQTPEDRIDGSKSQYP